jgi:hypothetical protein
MSEAFLIPTVSAEQIDQMPVHDFRWRSPYDKAFHDVQPNLHRALNVRLVPRLRVSPIERLPLLNMYGFVYEAVSHAIMADKSLLLAQVKTLSEVSYEAYNRRLSWMRKGANGRSNHADAMSQHQKTLFDHIGRSARELPVGEGSLSHFRVASCALLLSLEDQLWGDLDQQYFP